MTEFFIAGVIVGSIIAHLVGFTLGVRSERNAWLMRVNTKDNNTKTCHHVEGKCYYILEESLFVQQYVHLANDKESTKS